jgi:hypothetical protein
VAAVVVTLVVALATAAADAELDVKRGPHGEIAVVARQAPIGEALDAIGDQAGFDVTVYAAPRRPPLDLTLPLSPVDRVLREILRGRNYAVLYDSEAGGIEKVILLAPSSVSRAPAVRPPPRRPAKGKGAKQPAGAVVIRN